MFHHRPKLFPEEKTREEVKSEFKILLCVFIVGFFFFLLLTCINSVRIVKDYTLEKKGIITTGQIIQRVRQPEDKGRVSYFLRYQFKNKYADETCKVEKEYRVTPKDKACIQTIRRYEVTEKVYKMAHVNDSVNVLYLPSDKKTQSKVITDNSRTQNLWVTEGILIFMTLMMGLLVLRWSAAL